MGALRGRGSGGEQNTKNLAYPSGNMRLLKPENIE